ncbi:RidA family protein [Lysobacter antibioticus]|uniref:Endoribonuclease L-PSP family protein n=1 Tax=Lysobacter antibioticus TaxID=84531 RepID=A0A0S2F5S5_LYSAN|nr:RidA family protein [Lysobacter antibioticus]ALN78892.1 endoribonuclease L-PSP family protein [Lysobacter antibioticus]
MQRRSFLLTGAAAMTLLSGPAGASKPRSKVVDEAGGDSPTASDGESIHAAQTHLITAATRLLFVSGQIPVDAQGEAPRDFSAQCALAWANIETQLRAADMDLRHLAKLTVFLARARDRKREHEIRHRLLAGRADPAVSVVVTGIYDEAWRIEIEAIALV